MCPRNATDVPRGTDCRSTTCTVLPESTPSSKVPQSKDYGTFPMKVRHEGGRGRETGGEREGGGERGEGGEGGEGGGGEKGERGERGGGGGERGERGKERFAEL